MQSPATERVNEQTSRRKRRKATLKNRKPFAESHTSPLRPKVSTKKRKREEKSPSNKFYKIQGILEEKRESGRLLYLIDWEDNPETGETYDQSWEPRENLTKDAITDWESKKPREKTPQRFIHTQSSAHISDPDSQPIRSAKRRRLDSRANLSSPTSKKPRRAGTAETARFQSVSQAESLEFIPLEIKDSYEEELSNASGGIRVVVQVDEDFDRDAYTKLSIESSQSLQRSQPSNPSQPSQASQVYQDSLASRPEQLWQHSQNSVYAAPQFKTPRPRRGPFIWDEDIPSVIPDSQDLPGSSSFEPSVATSSKTGINSGPNSEHSTEGALGTPLLETQLRSSYLSTESSGIYYRRSEPPSYRPREKLLNDELEIISHRRKSSAIRSLSGGRPISPLIEASQPESLALSVQAFAVERAATSESHITSRIPISAAPAQPPLELLSEEATQVSSQGQDLQSTGLAAVAKDISEIDNSNEFGLIEQGSSGQSHPSINSESQNLIAGPRDRHPTQGSISSFEATWQAAQVVPFDIELLPVRDSTTTFRGLSKTPLQHGLSQPSANSGLSHLNSNSTNSPQPHHTQTYSQAVSESISSQKHFSYQGLEDVLESIEPKEDSIFIPPRPSPPSSLHPSTYGSYPPEHSFASVKTSEMSDQNEGTLGVAEILRRARAAAAASTTARQDAERERLASLTPATSALAASQVLPPRDPSADISVIMAHRVSTSPKSSPEIESKIRGLQILPLGPAEYAIPLPMVSVARSIYTTELINHKKDIKALIENTIDSNGMDRIHSVISNITLLCDHQDLVTDDTATQENYTDLVTANYAENVSTKCQLIAGLLKGLRSSHEHIAILVRPGRMTRILEAMCRYYEIDPNQLRRPTTPSQLGKWPLQVTIIPTNFEENGVAPQLASLVVAFDSSFKPGQYPSLRLHPLHPSQLVPLVHLVVTHSIEHLVLCIDEQVDSLDRTRALIDSAYQTREEMGKLDSEEYFDPEVSGKTIAAYILIKDPSSAWPLLPMPEIEGLDLTFTVESLPNSQMMTTQPSASTTQSHNTSSPAQSGFKRSLGVEDVLESSKRQRLTPIPGEQGSSLENGDLRINETVLAASNSSPSSLAGMNNSMANPSSIKDSQEESVPALLKKVARLEEQIQAKNGVEAELRQFNQELESRCKDYENNIQAIQPKYQEALNDQGRFQHELTEAVHRVSILRQKYDTGINNLAKIREEKAAVDAELLAARATLFTSAIPEISEFSKIKTDLRTAQENCEKLQKRITNMQSEVDYMRGQYQTASTAAADSAAEISELNEQNAVLKRKSSDNARQIHEIQSSSEIKQHLERIEELENEKADLETELIKKTEELKTLLNGRRTTRGTSVPRSPRMGTMSPNVRERPMARVLNSGVVSRGNSPAPGEAAPFRGTFGDALFAEKGVGRWANHLT